MHRLVWERAYGHPVPASLIVMHTCDVRNCVNLDHLVLGTHAANMADAHRKGRSRPFGGPTVAERRSQLVAKYRNAVLADLLEAEADRLAADHSTEKD